MTVRYSFMLSTFVCLACSAQAFAQSLSYRWQQDQDLIYKVEAVSELPDQTETLQGVIRYKLKAAGDPAKVTYSGGLRKSVRNKPGSRPSSPAAFGPFGSRFGGPPHAFGPFGARQVNPFKGLEQTTSQITIDAQGTVLAMKGTSHLPWLLGQLSLLVFEPLPEEEQKSWKFDSSLTISEKRQTQRSRFDRFGPFGPFGNVPEDKERLNAASEVVAFELESATGPLETYTKTVKLTSPGGDISFTIEGSGKWTFNRQLGVAESSDFAQRLSISKDNVSLVIPTTVKYSRLTPEQFADYEKERMAAEKRVKDERLKNSYRNGGFLPSSSLPVVAEMRLPEGLLIQWKKDSKSYWPATVVQELPDGTVKAKEVGSQKRVFDFDRGRLELVPREIEQPGKIDEPLLTQLYAQADEAAKTEQARQERHQKLMEQAKANSQSPIPDDQREELLLALKSNEYREIQRALQLVAVRTPRDDEELKQAITPLVDHMDTFLQKSAKTAMLNCAPDLKRIEDLNRSYREFNFTRTVTEMGPAPAEDTLLPSGLIVAGQFHRKWRPATIVRVREDGRVDVKFGPFAQTVKREDLRLAPPEVEQPNLDPKLLEAMKLVAGNSEKSPSSAETEAQKLRTWTSGNFKMEATYLGVEGDNVLLKRKQDGREIKVPLARLSPDDQEVVKSFQKPAEPDNPFDP